VIINGAELYPVHVSSVLAPEGHIGVIEPKVIREYDYRPIMPPQAPYELTRDYMKRLWIC